MSEERRDERACVAIKAAVEPKALGWPTGASLLNYSTISRAAGFEIGLIVICVIWGICGLKGVRK
jgi:hypothetical protein